jgi:septum formation protein
VEFDELTETEIQAYIATGEPLDKAGAYAIQGRAAAFIKEIKGSFSNVVGLPLNATIRLAEKAGVDLYGNHGERFTDN